MELLSWVNKINTPSSDHAFASFLDMVKFLHDGPVNGFYFFAWNAMTAQKSIIPVRKTHTQSISVFIQRGEFFKIAHV
jgi:hypothetical protein